ncbi:MAG TPA: sigma-54 dependent transcriptional regulator, partial [Rudaea sp.]
MSAGRVLIVDDEPDIRSTVKEILEDEGYVAILAANADEARAARERERPDAILLDIWMPGTDGIALLREWAAAGALAACPVVMMSGHGTVETAVEATRLGAWDFIEKPISLAKLLLTLERAREASRLRHENEGLRQRLALPLEPVGASKAMTALRAQLQKLAQHDASVLIRGEAGTGKETLARWLHAHGPRRNGPFVAVAAGSIPRDHLVAALFGTEDANGVQPGLLEQANGGTLFLDEVADLDAELQQRLFSVLQQRALVRGGGRGPAPLDLRVIAASARDLDAQVKAGAFREE